MTTATQTTTSKPLDTLASEIYIRPAANSDLGFIFSTWVNGFMFGNPHPDKEDEQREGMKRHRRILEFIVGFPQTRIAVAALITDPDVIIGYSVFQPKRANEFKLHWVFVKQGWRKLGIGRSLIPDGTNEVTHITALGRDLLPKGWSHTPLT